MKTTFLIARHLAVSPFDVMKQDLEHVIMVINFIIDSADENKTHEAADTLSDKENDRAFWSAF
jgi:hypothetical protein